jgi:hypothetical protein
LSFKAASKGLLETAECGLNRIPPAEIQHQHQRQQVGEPADFAAKVAVFHSKTPFCPELHGLFALDGVWPTS